MMVILSSGDIFVAPGEAAGVGVCVGMGVLVGAGVGVMVGAKAV